MAVFRAAVMAVLLRLSAGQDGICNYTYDVQPEQTYYINDTNLRDKANQCNWIGHCPAGYRCRLDCHLHLPNSPGCSADQLLISRSEGSKDYAHKYCGPGSTKFVSFGDRISAGLKISSGTPRRNFTCQLTAQKAPCRCGYKYLPNKWSRIVGGEESGVTEFPMMAFAIRRGGGTWGAVILDKRYVLTVAHAVHEAANSDMAVAVGKHNMTFSKDTPGAQVFRVDRVIVHPRFSNSSRDYDIAIMHLKGDIKFSDRVGPACLPFRFTRTSFTGSEVTMLGWGKLSENGSKPELLQKVNVTVISESECRAKYPDLTPRQICTYTPGKDACQGDSGGPMLYRDPGTGLLFVVGVISHGRGCAVEPAINTRVTDYIDWIRDNTPDAEYCYK